MNKAPKYLLDNLFPVCLVIEFEIKIAPKIRVQLRLWNEVKKIRIKPHLGSVKSCFLRRYRLTRTLSRVTGSKNGEMPL